MIYNAAKAGAKELLQQWLVGATPEDFRFEKQENKTEEGVRNKQVQKVRYCVFGNLK
jgi:hypothetical protein